MRDAMSSQHRPTPLLVPITTRKCQIHTGVFFYIYSHVLHTLQVTQAKRHGAGKTSSSFSSRLKRNSQNTYLARGFVRGSPGGSAGPPRRSHSLFSTPRHTYGFCHSLLPPPTPSAATVDYRTPRITHAPPSTVQSNARTGRLPPTHMRTP